MYSDEGSSQLSHIMGKLLTEIRLRKSALMMISDWRSKRWGWFCEILVLLLTSVVHVITWPATWRRKWKCLQVFCSVSCTVQRVQCKGKRRTNRRWKLDLICSNLHVLLSISLLQNIRQRLLLKLSKCFTRWSWNWVKGGCSVCCLWV